uniref:Uncharacterized protein n=1 Tax=Noctiluca scintillans TaxID=2966 RepID=A0A7S1EVB4_NOCSC|mmetsp:Transcript_11943/g.32972  ORF Transcript_11943/g.32972 Transcript_11943/m.32972 type:complete len:106 (+) Transcript_11943:665-982(+)
MCGLWCNLLMATNVRDELSATASERALLFQHHKTQLSVTSTNKQDPQATPTPPAHPCTNTHPPDRSCVDTMDWHLCHPAVLRCDIMSRIFLPRHQQHKSNLATLR